MFLIHGDCVKYTCLVLLLKNRKQPCLMLSHCHREVLCPCPANEGLTEYCEEGCDSPHAHLLWGSAPLLHPQDTANWVEIEHAAV